MWKLAKVFIKKKLMKNNVKTPICLPKKKPARIQVKIALRFVGAKNPVPGKFGQRLSNTRSTSLKHEMRFGRTIELMPAEKMRRPAAH